MLMALPEDLICRLAGLPGGWRERVLLRFLRNNNYAKVCYTHADYFFVRMNIELNEQFENAMKLLEDGDEHVFITGRAGTGKSTLLQHFRASTKKSVAVLAPTGVAALNVQGQTIHSFFGFPPSITPDQAANEHPFEDMTQLIEKLEILIIDEVSMLRADLLDSIDQALRQYGALDVPFGGKRMVFIGDLFQLPPVLTRDEKVEFLKEYASPYFFSAKVFDDEMPTLLELEKIYRQKDEDFIHLLNSVRDAKILEDGLALLATRHNPAYEAYEVENEITLCTTNKAADDINAAQLQKVNGKKLRLVGKSEGNFIRQLPTDKDLEMRVGAQVMLLNNDGAKRWVNGSMGVVTGFGWDEATESDVLRVELDTGKEVEVLPFKWESSNYYYDRESKSVEMEVVGSYTQHPVRLAWAVTIHKSQGKSFDNVVVDIGSGVFAHGQVYVALSRCTSLEGLVLRKPLLKQHIWCDYTILAFLEGVDGGDSSRALTLGEKVSFLDASIDTATEVMMEYVQTNGSRISRRIRPLWVGEMEYEGNEYMALEATFSDTGEKRAFSVKRILRLSEVEMEE
jgi:ATP-dependent DNA helicase PIF1